MGYGCEKVGVTGVKRRRVMGGKGGGLCWVEWEGYGWEKAVGYGWGKGKVTGAKVGGYGG